MSETNDSLQALLSQLAEGTAVDWDTQEINNPTDVNLLAQLKNINDIQQLFASQGTAQQKADKTNLNILFDWGHLQVLEKLGEGGYGEVYRAFDPVLNRDVALKLLKHNQLASFHTKLFIEEAQRIAQVRNRHVLAIHGASVFEGRAGFWSDLIVGDTLNDRIQMPLEDLLQVADAMSLALTAVHQAGLVHGDVKAANVMRDQNKQYVLMDFGAGLASDSEYTSNHSIGSPMLMAPELFQEQAKSPASDIYALGCLLFKLASGDYPVQGDNILDIAAAHQQLNYRNLKDLRSDLPSALNNLVMAMIAPEPANRPSAAQVNEMVDDIVKAPARKKKRRLVTGIIGSLFLGMVISGIGFLQANQARKAAVIEQQKAESVNEFLQQILGSAFELGEGREVRVADILDVAAASYPEIYADHPYANAAISEAIGRSYKGLKMLDESLVNLTSSLQFKKTLYGNNHPETWQVKLQVGQIHNTLRNFDISQSLFREIIDATQGENNVGDFRQLATVSMAEVLDNQGEFKAAHDLLDELLDDLPSAEIAKTNYPFTALRARGHIFLNQSKFNHALEAFNEALAWYESFPRNHLANKLSIYSDISTTLIYLSRPAEAEVMMRENLLLAERLYGKNNSAYLGLLSNLGGVLQSQGKLNEAKGYLLQVVDLAADIKGKSHLLTIIPATNLSNVLVSLGEINQGEKLMRETLQQSRASLGKEHMQTFTLEYNLSELLNNKADFKAAEALARKSLESAQSSLGAEHLITLLTQDNLAISLSGQGQHTKAHELHQQVLNDMKRVFGEDNQYTVLVWSHWVKTLQTGGKTNQAIDEQGQLVLALAQVHGKEHPATLEAQQFLVNLKQQN